MSEDKYVVKFIASHSMPGGPGYNYGEQASFSKADADLIVKLKRGMIVRVVPSVGKAPSTPDKNKMISAPAKKKRERLEVP